MLKCHEVINVNVLHMKYAVAIADAGSLNKASDALLIAQPNLSRAIKELEADIGITVFDRSSKGMTLTPDGEKFIACARRILSQIDEVESMYRGSSLNRRKFTVAAPYLSYVSQAFASFSLKTDTDAIEFFYNETNSGSIIDLVLNGEYRLGVVRCAQEHEKYLRITCEDRDIVIEPLASFKNMLLTSKNSEIAAAKEPDAKLLSRMTEVIHADRFVPSKSLLAVRKLPADEYTDNKIFVYERASQLDVLSEDPRTFMWASPIPEKLLNRYGLVQIPWENSSQVFCDFLIYKKSRKMSSLDKMFIEELMKMRDLVFNK